MAAEGYAVDVVTGDRDALQLVTDDVTVYLTKKGITQMLAVTPASWKRNTAIHRLRSSK